VLRALRSIAAKGQQYGKPVTLCGELASSPVGALVLVAIGYRALSVTPSAVGPVKALLLDLDAAKAKAAVDPLIDAPAGSVPVRQRIEAFAAAEGLQL
jgi:phosphotransferase system enzyme I (PtsP)